MLRYPTSMDPEVSWQYSINLRLPPSPATIQASFFKDKAPILQMLARSYQFRTHFRDIHRSFGAFQLSALCILGPDAINAISEDPAQLRSVGDVVRYMTDFFISGAIPQAAAATNTAPPRDRNPRSAFEAKQRDGFMGLFTLDKSCCDAAHILPYAMNATGAHLSFFRIMVPVLTTMFGKPFALRLKSLVGTIGASDQGWNLLTLSASVHRLYDAGLIGFRPKKITKTSNKTPETFHVHFGIHWLPKTELKCCHEVRVDSRTLGKMVQPLDSYTRQQNRLDIYNTATGKRVVDGTLVTIEHGSLEDAQKMFDCLVMSWAMRMILYLAGGAGTPDGDPRNHEEYDAADDFPDLYLQSENHLAIINEYLYSMLNLFAARSISSPHFL